MKKFLKDFLLLTFGTVFMTIGIYFFKFPNHFSTGGVSGISMLLEGIFPSLSSGLIMMVINLFLLLVGFVFVGKEFGIKTVYCSILLSVLTYALEFILPMDAPFTDNKLLELIFAILLPAIGSALLFNLGASTGGTDIVAMIIKKHSNLNISNALLCADMVIVMLTVFIFGIETWLYCILGLVSKVFVVNIVIESLNTSKYFTIITTCEKEISQFITTELHRGATLSSYYSGAFSQDEKSVILTVVNRSQAITLRDYIKSVDPHAFIIINNTSNIIGKGFRECI
ncbi:MAG: YitT family protein [Ruminococcaceae bacterium]|nr:YitT family protein [Oscillospiraceae bacterium]